MGFEAGHSDRLQTHRQAGESADVAGVDADGVGLVDLESFAPSKTSPARNAASGRVPYITKDHYGNERYRGAAADLGAVEAKE